MDTHGVSERANRPDENCNDHGGFESSNRTYIYTYMLYAGHKRNCVTNRVITARMNIGESIRNVRHKGERERCDRLNAASLVTRQQLRARYIANAVIDP